MDNSKKFLKETVRLSGQTRKYRYICFFTTMLLTLADTLFAFCIPFATENFKNGHQKIAIAFLVVSILNQLIYSILGVFDRNFDMKYRMLSDIDSNQKTVDILGVVRNKVYVTENKIRRRLNSVEVQENTKNYIVKTRLFNDSVIDGITQFMIFIGMFMGTIATTMLTVKNISSLIIIMTICIVVITLVTIRQIKRREMFFKEKRSLWDISNSQKMDILSVLPINQKHQHFLTDNYINSSKEIQLKEIKITMKERIEQCYKSGTMSISTIILLFIAIFSNETLDIGTFASLMALASLYNRLLQSLTQEISSIQSLIDYASDKKSYNTVMKVIIDKYLELTNEKYENLEKINHVKLSNLDFVHEDTENKVLHRIIADELTFTSGESTLIYGESGSGKSTLIKILSGIYSYESNNILINNEFYRSSLYNYIMYDPESTLGSRNILEEVTLDSNKSCVDKQKLIDILKGLSLYEVIMYKAQHEPILDYLQSVFKDTFSAGQIQRFVLARLLYNLESNTGVVILDEPIANLDDITASNVVAYINTFCNTDTSRIVLIASHQVKIVEKFCKVKYSFNNSNENYFKIESI